MNSIHDTFKQFCKERHEEDKILHNSKNFNLMQEIYADTELFDISLYDFSLNKKTAKGSEIIKNGSIRAMCFTPEKELSLPFQNNFIKCETMGSYIFIREYEPNLLTGSMYVPSNNLFKGNFTFYVKLYTDTKQIVISTSIKPFLNANIETIKNHAEQIIENLFITIIACLDVIGNLPNRAVVSDTPNTTKYEYYRRKHDTTIKKPVKPIYYVLDKKEETTKHKYHSIRAIGKLEFNHSFKVRGFWRRISEKSYGKDRQGNYVVLGYTWVVEHYRGNGELVKKLRVIK